MSKGSGFSYRFILEEEEFFVHDEHELALVLDLLSKTPKAEMLCWNVLMSLDEKLLSIIRTYNGINKCLKPLSRKNRFLLFVKIGDILANVLGSSDAFSRILATIPESSDQLRLIKIFRSKGFESIIANATDLGKVLEWATPEAERAIFELLTGGFLRQLLASSKDLYDFLHYVHHDNKDLAVERIGWEFIHSRVFAAEDFFYALKAISLEATPKYLALFSVEWIKRMIGSQRVLDTYLMRLSFTKQNPLLEYLGYEPAEFNIPR
jgi:hypothetical protein